MMEKSCIMYLKLSCISGIVQSKETCLSFSFDATINKIGSVFWKMFSMQLLHLENKGGAGASGHYIHGSSSQCGFRRILQLDENGCLVKSLLSDGCPIVELFALR
jgi:hypothetical protein